MRIDQNTPGAARCKVFLNDQLVAGACVADEEAGYVDIEILDAADNPIIDRRTNDLFRARLEGTVRVERPQS